jgi:AAA-like domain/TIR domain
MPHDIFISHSTNDRAVAERVCSELETQRLSCWIAPRDIDAGEAWDEAIIRALDNCRIVLLIFSGFSNESPQVKREIHHAIDKKKTVVPLRIEDVKLGRSLEYIMMGIQWFDAFPPPLESHLPALRQQIKRILVHSDLENAAQPTRTAPPPIMPRDNEDNRPPAAQPVLAAPTEPQKPRVVLLYKRNMQPDGYVLQLLERNLRSDGYDVFVDRHMQIGVEWAHEIERNIRTADAVIPILSQASMLSEMVNYEVEIAHEAAQAQHGKPRLLPVRVGYKDSLGETLDAILQPIQYALWNSQSDDEAVLTQLRNTLKAKEEMQTDPGQQEQPGGAVPLNSRFYIARPSDEMLKQALSRNDTIILIKGGRQMGKTSLLARGLQQVRSSGATVVYTDLQKLNASDLSDIRQFYCALAHMLADQLNIDRDIEDCWKERRAPSVNFEQYLTREVMVRVGGHLFWGLDEVDRLFACDYASEVFGLFRSWHNERASNPETPWNKLTMIIAYATEAHLFIADPNQSPFNVGTRLELRDFTVEQVEALNELYGKPLFTSAQLARFYELLSGQPYLVRRGLHELTESKMPFEEFSALADRDEGPYGDHLRRMLVMLARDPRLIQAVRSVLDGSNTLSMDDFYRMRAAGILVGESAVNCKMRCALYGNYLRSHLS